MRICLDARSVREVVTGLGRYAAHLVRALAALDQENEYIVLRRSPRRGPLVHQENFTEIDLPYDLCSLRNVLVGARTINALQADVYHALFHFLPLGIRAGQTVVTLHDLIWVQQPALADGRRWRRWLKGSLGSLGIRYAVSRADHVVAVSTSTRQDALSVLRTDPAKMTVIHHGVDPVFAGGNAGTFAPATGGRPFIFALGNALPYKNLPRLVRAFAVLAPEYPDLCLLLAGRGETYPALTRLVAGLNLGDRVRFAGLLSDAEVLGCYARARLFAFPSLVEGFGLPVLEAMASGCPVLTSRQSAPAEITGPAAELVEPTDVASIATGLRRLLDSPARREALVTAGRGRAAAFTWEECGRRTLELYRRLRPGAARFAASQVQQAFKVGPWRV